MTTPPTCPVCDGKLKCVRLFGSGVPTNRTTGIRKRRWQVVCPGCRASGPVAEDEPAAWYGWDQVLGHAQKASA